MPSPILTTPVADSDKTCKECGSTLKRTGKVITYADGKQPRGFRGWLPSLLVVICPTCDSRKDAPVEAEPEPTIDAAREAYLDRLDPGRKNIGGAS